MDTPNSLVIALVVVIQLATVVGTYLLFNGRQDDKSRLWLMGLSLMALGISLTALRPLLPVYWTHPVVWLVVLCSVHLMLEAIRRELGEPNTNWLIPGLIVSAYFVYSQVIYFLGLSESLGYVTQSGLMAIYCPILLINIYRLQRKIPSKGLIVLLFGMALYTVPSVLRFVYFLITQSYVSINVYAMNPVMSIISAFIVIAILFVSLGYWGFTLEKFERERNQARVGQQLAENDAEAMRQLVQQRDQLLVMNSRLSVISALSSFSAMLVHDISQPLQTLQLGLERIRNRLSRSGDANQVMDQLKHLEHASERAGTLVAALRHLMKSGQSQTTSVWLKPLFDQVDEILHGEALQKRVQIVFDNRLAPETMVVAEPVMLQRLLINVVSNALNQFQAHPVDSPAVSIQLSQEIMNNTAGVAIVVSDNGGGFPESLLARLGQPWSSDRPDGMGMALMLSKQLMTIWGGQLLLSNRTDGIAGASVKIWLKQAS